jgi:hypothetical protein
MVHDRGAHGQESLGDLPKVPVVQYVQRDLPL